MPRRGKRSEANLSNVKADTSGVIKRLEYLQTLAEDKVFAEQQAA